VFVDGVEKVVIVLCELLLSCHHIYLIEQIVVQESIYNHFAKLFDHCFCVAVDAMLLWFGWVW